MKLATRPLIRAVLAGTLAAGSVAVAIAAAMTLPFVGSWNDLAAIFKVFGSVVAVTFVLVLLGVLLLGLPTIFILHRLNRESEWSYVATGVFSGFLLPFAPLLAAGSATQGYSLCLLGAVGGGAAGKVWWRTYRQAQADERN